MGQGAISGLSGIASAAGGPIGMGVSAIANIGMGLAEASKQKELQRSADREVEKAAAEQERLLSQNFFEGLQVPMQAYDREFRETTAQQQQAMSALQEGDPRLLIGGVGKVQAIAAEQEAKTREDLGKDLFNIGKLQAEEAGQTADKLAMLEGQRLAGAQQASADAAAARLKSQQGALQAGGDLIKGLGSLVPEYSGANANDMDMSTALKSSGISATGPSAASQLQSGVSGSLNPLYKQYSWGSLANPSMQSQLSGSTNNVLAGFRMPG